MKLAMALVLLFGLVVAHGAPADKSDAELPHWVIIATLIDRTTGKRLEESQLQGPELEFDDRATCRSIVARVRPIQNKYVDTVLTCRKVGPEHYL